MIVLFLSQGACDIYVYLGLLQLSNAAAASFSPVQKYQSTNHFVVVNRLLIRCGFRIIEHPNYSGLSLNYDVALLRMRNGFNLPTISNVAPACLPSASTPSNVNVSILYGTIFYHVCVVGEGRGLPQK